MQYFLPVFFINDRLLFTKEVAVDIFSGNM